MVWPKFKVSLITLSYPVRCCEITGSIDSGGLGSAEVGV